MLEVKFWGLGEIADNKLKFAVIDAAHKGNPGYCLHRGRNTWEIPGGHREPEETIEAAARRELFEETGAAAFTLTPVCVYSVTGGGADESFGMLFAAEIGAFGPMPDSEMLCCRVFEKIPAALTYPEIQPKLAARAAAFRASHGEAPEADKPLARETNESHAFWRAVDALIAGSEVVIDRPAGTRHPRYPDFVYPLDYGYLGGTASMDGQGIDVWRGSLPDGRCDAVICTVDLWKRDSEVKLLLGCTEDEIQTALRHHNGSDAMKGLLIRRGRQDKR